MSNKSMRIIVIVLVAIILVIGILIAIILLTPNNSNVENTVPKEIVKVEPVISVNKEVNEENKNQMIITVEATIEDEIGIKEVILPDGTSVVGSKATFTVEENGKYKFEAVSNKNVRTTQEIEVTELEEHSSANPYIPEGFVEAEDTGTVEEGYVIEDSYGNQYTWVPVETGKLTRNTVLDADYEEKSNTASALVNSVSKYYGFYIGRYESSKNEINGEIISASMPGKDPWTNVTYTEAISAAENADKVYGYKDCHTALINSYAWDTTLKWIDSQYPDFSKNTNYGNYSMTILPTGYTESDNLKHICDIAGNVREWTTETYREITTKKNNSNNEENIIQRIIRGGGANLSKTPTSHIPYPENLSDNYWGFRMILYR